MTQTEYLENIQKKLQSIIESEEENGEVDYGYVRGLLRAKVVIYDAMAEILQKELELILGSK